MMTDTLLDTNLDAYDYHLPEELIAQSPTLPEHNAKLLICSSCSERYENKKFIDLPESLTEDTQERVLFFNDTKVYKARVPLDDVMVHRATGHSSHLVDGEIFVYKILDTQKIECLVSDDKHYKPGTIIEFNSEIKIYSLEYSSQGMILSIEGSTTYDFLEKYGQMPLPPYVDYDKSKEKYYQICFARETGSAAAPTASLHFTQELLDKLYTKNILTEYLTLHVELWTFKPLYHKELSKNTLHKEEVHVPLKLFTTIAKYKLSWKKFVAVGTTVARSLESLRYLWNYLVDRSLFSEEVQKFWKSCCQNDLKDKNYISNVKTYKTHISFETQIFIYPGYQRGIVDEMITNFHLPKSSLLVMISAFMWREQALSAYTYAVDTSYKFYSFGDGMWIKNIS